MATTARTILLTKVKGHFEWFFGRGVQQRVGVAHNNAEPVADGECCGQCNDRIVVPKRLEMFYPSE